MTINLSAPAGYTSSNLVFNDNFSGTKLSSHWNTYITSNAAQGWAWNDNGSGGSGPGGPYDADYDMPSQISVNNGLTLTAVKRSVVGMNQGVRQTFPITSGAVSSYGKFEFTGGYLQVSMAAPSGDGAWPSLWLLPGKGAGSSGDNYEIDMEEGGYTPASTAKDNISYHLHTPSGTYGTVVNTGTNLTSGYNTYGINWVPGKSITWYLNGKETGLITSAQASIPTKPMELIMNLQVADSKAAGWHTVLDSSTPQSMAMKVGDVQLYQKAGSGDTVLGRNVNTSAVVASTAKTSAVVASPATMVTASAQQPTGSRTASSGTSSVVTKPTVTKPAATQPAVSSDPVSAGKGSSQVTRPHLSLGQGTHADSAHQTSRFDSSQFAGLIRRADTLAPQPAVNTGSPESWGSVGAKASSLLNQFMASGSADRFHFESFSNSSAASPQQQVATLTKPLH